MSHVEAISVVAHGDPLVRLFNNGVRGYPRRRSKYYRTGMALLKSGKVDDGVEALEKAFSLMPHPNTLLTLARVFEPQRLGTLHPLAERYLEFDPIDKADVQELITKMR